MGGFASGLADSASNLLGGGPAALANAPKMVDASAQFTKDDPVDSTNNNAPGATALDHANIFDPGQPTEFIHFGHVHADITDSFTHAVLDDTKTVDAQNVTSGSHAILFRAALEREAILIDGFIAAAQSVVQEMKDGEGSTTALVGAVSDLLSGANTTQGPDPTQLNPYKTAVDTAGGAINVAAIQYKAIHQAGIDLHKAWSNFDKFAPDMAKSPADNGQSGGGLMGNLGSAMGGLGVGGIMDDIKPVTNILFKMFDIYEGMYQNLRKEYEPVIRTNCHQRSMEAIRAQSSPATRGIFDVWSVPLPAADDPADPVKLVPDNTGISPIDKAAGAVNNTATDIAAIPKKIEDAWTKFWTCTPAVGPGTAETTAIVAAFAAPYDLIFQAFSTGLGVGDLPDFVKTVLTKIIDATSGMLGCVYVQLQNPEAAAKMDENAFLAAGRYYFLSTLTDLAKGLLPTFSQALPMVGALTTGMLVDKAGSLLDEEVGKDIDPILEYAMKSVLGKLQAADQAAGPGGITMEAYFSQIPLLIALITRNTFFPVWQLVVEKLFSKLGLPAALIVTPVSAMMQKAKDAAAGAKKDITDLDANIKNKANSAASGIGSDANNAATGATNAENSALGALGPLVGGGNPLSGAQSGLASSVGSAASSVASSVGSLADSILGAATAGPAGPGPAFPGVARVTTGNGVDITQDEWTDVDTNQQVQIATGSGSSGSSTDPSNSSGSTGTPAGTSTATPQ